MKNKIILYSFLGIIILIGFFIRFYNLGVVPASPDWDEVALGYNAYSILQTGKDEYGEIYPIVLRSFDDYKPAAYAYLVIPFIQLFGLTVFAVRIPSVIIGVLSILVTYFLVNELFRKELEFGSVRIKKEYIALLTAFLLSISPWHIQFSRVAFEAQVGLFCNLISILFFLKSFKNRLFLPLSFVFAGLSIYVYQSEKVYVPLLFFLLLVVYRKDFLKIPKKWIVASFIFGLMIVLPMISYILSNPSALNRAKGVSVFSDSEKLLSANSPKLNRDMEAGNYIGLVLDNRRVEYVKIFISGYLSHFEPNWLFYRGDELRHQPPYMGLVYLSELPFILIGIYVLLFSKIDRKIKIFVVSYILLAPVPASITIDVPHAVRTINMLPGPQLLASIGLLYILSILQKQKKIVSYPLYVSIFIIFTLNLAYYFNQYFIQMNYYYSSAWQYGWEEAVEYTISEADRFEKVIVTNEAPLDQSYMFYLFYLVYDPVKYQQSGGTKSGGFADSHTAFEKFEFRPINWEKDKFLTNTLFVGRSDDLPDNRGKVIYYLNGDPAIVFSERNE